MKTNFHLLGIIVLCLPFVIFGAKPFKMFAEGMVLQIGANTPVWGTGSNNEDVTITLNSQIQKSKVSNGKWIVNFTNLIQGGPYKMNVCGSTGCDTIPDVYLGDVWTMVGDKRVSGRLGDTDAVENPEIEVSGVNKKEVRIWDETKGLWLKGIAADAALLPATAWYMADELYNVLHRPLGIIVRASTKDDASSFGVQGNLFKQQIIPSAPMAMKGVFCWQSLTSSVFKDILGAWRGAFGDSLPFIYISSPSGGTLSLYGSMDPLPTELLDTTLAIAKAKNHWLCQLNPRVRMINSSDLPYALNPKNKSSYGKRLCDAALDWIYEFSITYSGPIYHSFKREGTTARIEFISNGGGLAIGNEGDSIQGVRLAGPEKKWYNAHAIISEKSLIVSHPSVTQITRIQYSPSKFTDAWGNLFNIQGFGAAPFDTDWGDLSAVSIQKHFKVDPSKSRKHSPRKHLKGNFNLLGKISD